MINNNTIMIIVIVVVLVGIVIVVIIIMIILLLLLVLSLLLLCLLSKHCLCGHCSLRIPSTSQSPQIKAPSHLKTQGIASFYDVSARSVFLPLSVPCIFSFFVFTLACFLCSSSGVCPRCLAILCMPCTF